MKRDGQQGAGIESGTTHKEKIPRDYLPRQQSQKSEKPKAPSSEKIRDGFKIR